MGQPFGQVFQAKGTTDGEAGPVQEPSTQWVGVSDKRKGRRKSQEGIRSSGEGFVSQCNR